MVTVKIFSTAITERGAHHVIARIPGSVAIAARGTISAFDVGFADRTDDTAIYDFLLDGTGIYRFTIVATDLPAATSYMDGHMDLTVFFGGYGQIAASNPSNFHLKPRFPRPHAYSPTGC